MGKKKIGGKSKKAKWNKLSDSSQVQQKLANDIQETLGESGFGSKRSSKTNLSQMFKIDIKPNQKTKERLEKDRFKKKQQLDMVSKNESKIVKKIIKKIDKKENQGKKQDSQAQMVDLWGSEAPHTIPKPVIPTRSQKLKNVAVPNILTPHGGQSYNPSMRDQHELMKIVVDQTEKRERKFAKKLQKILIKKKLRIKSDAQRKHLEEQARLKEEKRKQKDVKNFDVYVREVEHDIKQKKKRLEQKRKRISEIKKKIEKGEIQPYKRRIGVRKYELRPLEFKEEDEIDPRLRGVEASSETLRSKYDDIFRRGLLEPLRKKNKKRRWNVDKYKYHENHSVSWKERTQQGQKFEVIG